MRTVVEETQGASATGRVVDDFSHHRRGVVEEELVADTYLAGRFYEHIPKAHLLVEFAKEEYFYLRIGLLLCAIEACGEHLCVVEDEDVAFVEVVQSVAELQVFAFDGISVSILAEHLYLFRLLMDDHQSAFVTAGHAIDFLLAVLILILMHHMVWVQGNLLFRQFELKL